jgi:hypothetical protein
MKTLSLDLGLHTGWAIHDPQASSPIKSGCSIFRTSKTIEDSWVYIKFHKWLKETFYSYEGIERILIKEAHDRIQHPEYCKFYYGFLSIVMLQCSQHSIEYEKYNTKSIINYLSPKKNLNKEEVFKMAVKGGFKPSHANQAYAIYMLKLHIEEGLIL